MRFIPRMNRDELRKLRLKQGDVVVFNGDVYVVRQIGLKFARLSTPSGEPVGGLVHQQYLRRLTDEETERSPLDDISAPTAVYDASTLLDARHHSRRR